MNFKHWGKVSPVDRFAGLTSAFWAGYGFDVTAAPAIIDDLQTVLEKNKEPISQLIAALEGGCHLTPFIGAGLSVAYGYSAWSPFLVNLASKAGVEAAVQDYLKNGHFEEAAEFVREAMGVTAFEDAFEAEYGKPPTQCTSPTSLEAILRLSTGFVATTNYEGALPTEMRKTFRDPCVLEGNQVTRTSSSLRGTSPTLWQTHGSSSERASRILTRSEYCRCYEEPFDDGEPIIKRLLFQMLSGRVVLFAGCSLGPDRTMTVMKEWAGLFGTCEHYAILEEPLEGEREARLQFLSQRRIRPIFYPRGQHHLVVDILMSIVEKGEKFVQRTRLQGGTVISIASRLRPGEELPGADHQLNLSDRFEGQRLKDGFAWDNIHQDICSFLNDGLGRQRAIRLELSLHLSLAFLAGSCLPTKRGISASITQHSMSKAELWTANDGNDGPAWEVSLVETGNGDAWALVIEGFSNMRQDAIRHCSEELPDVGKILILSQPDGGKPLINGGSHASRIVQQACFELSKRSLESKRQPLHVFIGGPVSLAFLLGQEIFALGESHLYEFIGADQRYVPSIRIAR